MSTSGPVVRECFEQYARSRTGCREGASSVANAAQVTLASDNVFSDGASLELPAMSGSVAGGLTAALTVAV